MGLFNEGDEVAQLRARVAELEQRVSVLERLLQGLPGGTAPQPRYAAPGRPLPDPQAGGAGPVGAPLVPDEVVRLARDGKKIMAIKVMREHSGLGLAEAKEIVDRL